MKKQFRWSSDGVRNRAEYFTLVSDNRSWQFQEQLKRFVFINFFT